MLHLLDAALQTDQEQKEDDAVTRKDVDGMGDCQQLAAMRSLDDLDHLVRDHRVRDVLRSRLLERHPGQREVDDIEQRRALAQRQDEITAEQVDQVAQRDADDQFTEHRRLTEPARGIPSDNRQRQYRGNTEDDRDDRIGMPGLGQTNPAECQQDEGDQPSVAERNATHDTTPHAAEAPAQRAR